MKSVLEENIQAAIELTDMLASSLGPKGMDKMLVDNIGDVHVTNDGFTIIDKMEIKHPIAKIVAETAKTQDKEAGDGTTTVIVLTGELLKQALQLIKAGIHPTIITQAYAKALKDAIRILRSKAVKTVTEADLENMISTALTGKPTSTKHLTQVVLDAVKNTETDDILIVKKAGNSVEESRTIKGVLIDKEPVHPRMSTEAMNAKVLITRTPLEIEKTEVSTEIMIQDPAQLSTFLTQENNAIKKKTDSIINSGAKIAVFQKGISEKAQESLARAGIIALRRVREKDIDMLLKATKSRLAEDLESIKPEDLGTAELLKVEKIGDEKLTLIQGAGNVSTILIRGGTKQVIEEAERTINDALGVVRIIRKEQAYLPGAGLTELIISKELMNNTLKGKERLAYEGFSNALKKVTETLVRNTGAKPLDLMPELTSQNKGVSIEGTPINPISEGVIEPLKVKEQAITSATETAIMILRIDEILKGK